MNKFSIDEIEIIEVNDLFNSERYIAVWTPDYGTWEPYVDKGHYLILGGVTQ